jgi:hypothetical protein
LPFVQGLYPPYKDPVEKDSFKSKGTILSSINTSSVQKWKIPPKESPVPGKKKKIKKKNFPPSKRGGFCERTKKNRRFSGWFFDFWTTTVQIVPGGLHLLECCCRTGKWVVGIYPGC